MSRIVKRSTLVSMIVMILVGNAWGGWFTFEPNMVLLDGTSVARYLEDIAKENDYLKKGDTAKVNQLISDEKVYLIKKGQDQTRVKYLAYKEIEGSLFVQVQDESGSKIWVNVLGVACKGEDGKERSVTGQDLVKGKFKPL